MNTPTSIRTTAKSSVDDNQKRRRHRGGRARRLWKRWSSQNPVLATLLAVFVGLCVLGMLSETSHSGSGGVHRHSLKQRMRRAKALLRQATTDDGDDEEEEEEESGDDARAERRRRRQHEEEEEPPRKKQHGKRFPIREQEEMLDKLDEGVRGNTDGGIRWIAPYLMLPILATPGRQLKEQNDDEEMTRGKTREDAVNPKHVDTKSPYFKVKRNRVKMAWQDEYEALPDKENRKPPVDYTTHEYEYPLLRSEIPDLADHGTGYPDYPPLQPLGDLMKAWPQDNDFPGAHQRPIPEKLLHFNFSNPEELEMAKKFRDAELPFKLYDVPELTEAGKKWTDQYVTNEFDNVRSVMGNAQESPNNYFAFFQPNLWDVKTMGLPPVRTNDWSYERWSEHARYADAVGLNASKPHFYWQSGVPREERNQPQWRWSFISKDLPSWSSPTKTFFVFEPESQKGIQCRFGERGVVAATHYDSGRNMIAMVTGAKRYILAPPKECPNLGIVPWKFNSIFRHSLLNFGHINYLNNTAASELDDGEQGNLRGQETPKWKGDHMSQVEREWMEIAAGSQAVETVLKAGEVLYVPSHWFHYIVSLQKSAQCNVRSGVHDEGTPVFGGKVDVKTCGRLTKKEAMHMR